MRPEGSLTGFLSLLQVSWLTTPFNYLMEKADALIPNSFIQMISKIWRSCSFPDSVNPTKMSNSFFFNLNFIFLHAADFFFVFGVKIIVNDFFRFRKLETKNSKLVFYVTFPVLGGGRSRAGSESYPPEMIALTVDFFLLLLLLLTCRNVSSFSFSHY